LNWSFSLFFIFSLEIDLEKKLASHKGKHYPYSAVVEDLEKLQFPLSFSWGVVNHLMSVKNSEELRKAHDSLQPQVVEAQQKTGQSLPLFHALSNLINYPPSEITLDSAQKRIISSSLLEMKFSGVDLEPEKKERFNKLQLELAELSTKFSNNVLDSTKQFKLKITNKEEIAGLPDSVVALLAQNAKNNGDADASPEKGPWLITLDFPSYFPCMQHLKKRKLRESLYRAYVTRASAKETDNTPIIQRILQIKKEMAEILGYPSHAEKSLTKKMATNVENVQNLIAMLREKSFPVAQQELAQLQKFAHENDFQGKLQLW
jgi:oligopeptidase A